MEENEIKFVITSKEIDEYLLMVNPPNRIGRYQMLIFLILTVIWSSSLLAGLSAIYYGYTPPHHCKVDNSSQIPKVFDHLTNQYKLASCEMYSNDTNRTSEVVSCRNGWEYDRSQFEETIISEFNLICDRQIYFETMYAISSLISGISTVFISHWADKYGRRKICIMSFFIDRVAGLLFAVLPGIELISLAMGIASIAAAEFIPMLIAYELFPSKYRGFAGTVCNLVWIAIACLLPLMANFIRKWRLLILTWHIVAGIIGALGFWFVPESLTWLLSNGKYAEAEVQLRKIAKFNRIQLHHPHNAVDNDDEGRSFFHENIIFLERKKKQNDDDDDQSHVDENTATVGAAADHVGDAKGDAAEGQAQAGRGRGQAADCSKMCCLPFKKRTNKSKSSTMSAKSVAFRDLMMSAKLKWVTLIMAGLYLVNSIVYAGLFFITPYLSGNMHLNNFLITIVELPAYLSTVYILPRYGRKWPLMMYLLLCGVGLSSALLELIHSDHWQSWMPILSALVGKFGISGSYAVIALYATELFPTNLRSTAMAVCRVSEIIAQVLVPYSSLHLVKIAAWLPRVLFGALAVLIAIPVMVLPETKDRPLPETIEEIEGWK